MIKRMKNIWVLVFLVLFFLSILTIISPDIDAQETITVGPGGPPLYDFGKITDAINYANETDVIHVYSGSYSENIVINKSITLIGDGSGSTIITSAASNKNTLEVFANYTNISGFTIRNLGGSYACIQLNYANNCQIMNNHIENGENSVYLINSNNNTIKDNTINNNKNGIYLWTSNNNIVRDNAIQNNEIYGVFISLSSSENTIYLNDFSNNYGSNSRDDGNNSWDYTAQGNYWDDYNDYDTNLDGIGDNPYIISGSGGNKDDYPLGDFLSISKPIAYIDFISPNPSPKSVPISFNGHGTTPVGLIVAWVWKSDNVIISTNASFTTSSLSPGVHEISFQVQDNRGIWSDKVYETLTINPNQKPNAYILNPSGFEIFGKPVNFTAYAVDPDGEILGYLWRSVPNFISNSNASFTLDNIPVGNYTIYLKVKDNDNEWSTEVSNTLTILPNTTVINKAPIANANGPYSGVVNQSINFDGSYSYDLDENDTLAYYWDFGDGTDSDAAVVNHVYNTVGNYSVELTVTDKQGASSKNSTYAQISNVSNDKQNNHNKGIPGFELIYIIFTISIVVILKKINNKKRRF
jgi:parallel beta-helix repeat protein